MMKNFMEMVNVKIEEESLLTIGMKCGNIHFINAIVPDSISISNGIHIKGEWMTLDIPADCKITYDEFDDEFTIVYENTILYFS